MENASTLSKTDDALQRRIAQVAHDSERVLVLEKARAFKRSWVELAERLALVSQRESWREWGYASFDLYVRKELHITPATAAKLVSSYGFLQHRAPEMVARALREPDAPVPSLQAVDFVARAERRGAANDDTLREITQAAFDEGTEASALARRYKAVAFPLSDDQRRDQRLGQLAQAARRLATLLADADLPIPHHVSTAVEEAIGLLLECVERGESAS
jgi:hypothetical protein